MLRKVEVKNFKVFGEETFELPKHLVVVGPNNCGKTSLLQAIATWSEIANHWFETNPDFARLEDGNYPTADFNLLRFDSVPLRDFPHLWRNKCVTEPVSICVEAEGWRVGFEVVLAATEQARVRPMREVRERHLERCKERPPVVVYVPPISRLLVEEAPLRKDAVRARIRAGRVPEVLRNVVDFIGEDDVKWKQLRRIVDEFFGYELLRPSRGTDLIVQYRHRSNGAALDLSSAASGFLQVLASYATLLFEKASVILVDEPDAHLHLLLQQTAYRRLRSFAEQTSSQLVVATHSEVIIEGAKRDLRLLWRGFRELPEDERVGNILRLKNQVLMSAETEPGILYVEDESDVSNLREWARVLGHPLFRFLDRPFWEATATGAGRDYAARAFGALRRMVPGVKGAELRDGDTKVPQSQPAGLVRLRWCNKEIENYLVHPSALERFVQQERNHAVAEHIRRYMRRILPPVQVEAPFNNEVPFDGSAILSRILQEAGLQLKKTEYWQIAAQMRPDEVHPEVREKLDAIAKHFGIGTAEN